MASEEKPSNQLNLTVVALVALVAIVGLVALVMNAASVGKMATGSQIAVAQPSGPEGNTGGRAYYIMKYSYATPSESSDSSSGDQSTADAQRAYFTGSYTSTTSAGFGNYPPQCTRCEIWSDGTTQNCQTFSGMYC